MVFALFKAIPFGIFLTVIMCLFMGSGGTSGGFLHIRPYDIDIPELSLQFNLYWSWVLFLIGTGLAWALIFMMGD